MVRYCYIVTEGPQDVEFLICLLKFYGLRRVRQYSLLDSFWEPLVPKSFPIEDDLMKRVPVPIFLQNTDVSVALHSAVGIKRLADTIEESLKFIHASKLFSIGLVLDADDTQTPQARFEKLTSEVSQKTPLSGSSIPSVLGEVVKGSPRFGIFIMPNNADEGTLEDILLQCAEVNYPNLFQLSKKYVSDIDTTQLNKDDLRELNKPAGRKKAVVSSISSILKPGKTVQVSIQDNRWIDEKTIKLDSMKRAKAFLDEITGFIEDVDSLTSP